MSAMPEMIPLSDPGAAAPAAAAIAGGVRSERYWATLALMVAFVSGVAFLIGGYAQIAEYGYQLDHAQTRLTSLQQSNRILNHRAAELAEAARVVPDAQRMEMVEVDPSQTVYVSVPRPATAAPLSMNAKIARLFLGR